MRFPKLFIVLAAMVALAAASNPAQLLPGYIVVGANDGNLYMVSGKGGVVNTFASVGASVYGVDVDYNNDIICGGSAVVWHVDGRTSLVTTIKTGSPLTGLIGDVEVNQNGTFYLTSMSNNLVLEMDHKGTIITQYAMTGSTRTWGMGIDRRAGKLYVAGSTVAHLLDLGTRVVKTLYGGAPLSFCQGACMGPQGDFVIADETGQELFEIDSQGVITTVHFGPPFNDPGEGVDVLPSGDYVLADDGTGSPKQNKIWLVTRGTPAKVTTLVLGGPYNDLNGCTVVPDLVLTRVGGKPKPGTTAVFQVTSAGAAHDYYIFASSLSASRGTPLPGGKVFPLDFDNLMGVTLANALPAVFVNYQGFLDLAGQAVLKVNVPGIPQLTGIEFYTAGATINLNAPGAIHLLSNPVTTKIE